MLSDPEKLIIIFYTAKQLGFLLIKKEYIGSIVYLLHKEANADFNYIFNHWMPLPEPTEMMDDIYGLKDSGYLIFNYNKEFFSQINMIGITQKGIEWINEKEKIDVNILVFTNQIKSFLQKYLYYDKKQYFDLCFTYSTM